MCAPTPLQEAVAAVIGLPDSYYQWLQTFYASDPGLGRGLVRFAFPKKDETFELVEQRFEKLQA